MLLQGICRQAHCVVLDQLLRMLSLRLLHDILLPLGLCVVMLELFLQLLDVKLL